MKKGIIGRKLGMTQIFDAKGNVIPVTLIEAGPCVVAQKKTIENDGYNAVQLAYSDVKTKHVNKAQQGHFKKAGISPKRHLKEFRLDDCSALEVGSVVTVDTFAAIPENTVLCLRMKNSITNKGSETNHNRAKETFVAILNYKPE